MSNNSDGYFPEGYALVFGGSGGIGAETALLAADQGADVVLTYYSNADSANKVLDVISAQGRKALALQCDVRDGQAVLNTLKQASEFGGRLHSVFSAAGPLFRMSPLIEFDYDEFADVVKIDVMGFFNIVRATVPEMRQQGGGSITALLTCAIDRCFAQDAASAVPKAAVAQMLKQIAAEEGVHGIRANGVGPAVVNGGLAINLAETETGKAILDQAAQMTPLGRLAEPREIADALVYLASNRASYVTGQMVMSCGGLSV